LERFLSLKNGFYSLFIPHSLFEEKLEILTI
jgi:hypothetical protein